MIDNVRRVAELRNALSGLKEERARLEARFEDETKGLSESIELYQKRLEYSEDSLRTAALEQFKLDGNRKPTPGVEVKMFTELTYEPKQALAWAMEHKIALALDKKVFEYIAKQGTPGTEFASVTETPRAQIATDLDKALVEAKVLTT
ncbi:MAG: hypothetical protein U1D67_03550 [Dehalococcoidia bacterium]|nr:hypothetical protein [Dehalococcoidia bacterium]